MSTFTETIWQQATLAMAEEYLENIDHAQAKVILAHLVSGALISENLVRVTQARFITKMEARLMSILNEMMEALEDE